jgi:hypothetical protein
MTRIACKGQGGRGRSLVLKAWELHVINNINMARVAGSHVVVCIVGIYQSAFFQPLVGLPSQRNPLPVVIPCTAIDVLVEMETWMSVLTGYLSQQIVIQ